MASALVPLVVLLVVTTFALVYRSQGFEPALLASLAVALVSCPCALGVATPLAFHTALGEYGIPSEFIQMILTQFAQLDRFFVPRDALLFTMTEEHLPPAFNVRLAVSTVLDLVTSRAHTNRHTARAHLCVLDHAEQNETDGVHDPLLSKDVLQIMEYYSQNRLKAFYTDCFYALSKRASYVQKRFCKRCGCSEAVHLSVTTV